MITYNHEKYIAQAIDSIVNQTTSFRIELIIGEDVSTDNTRNIILQYAEKYPTIVKPILNKKNLGMMPNFIQTLNACSGKYVALCEGDDYWTDTKKLQKQVDFLEQNKKFVASYTRSSVLSEESKILSDQPYFKEGEVGMKELVESYFIMTATLTFRNILRDTYPQWMHRVYNGDLSLMLLLADKGNFYGLSETTSVYRSHTAGASRVWQVTRNRKMAYLMCKFNKYTKFKHSLFIIQKQFKLTIQLLQIVLRKIFK